MNKQDMFKIQTCVLRVNIHCEGCMHKVKKKLQKVEGVYKVSIDSEQGKVVVSGNADPASLIEKLERAGKHAELWGGPQKPLPVFVSGEQLKKFQQMESVNKNGKKGNHDHDDHHHQKNGGFVQIPQQKGFKDEKLFSAKDHKSVSFHLPEDVDFDDESDDEDFDEDDEEFDDDEESDEEFDEGDFDAHKPPAKAAAAGAGHKPSKAVLNAHHKGDKDKDKHKEKKTKKGGGMGIDVFLKSILKKAGRKKGDSDKKKSKKGDKKKEDGGKNGGKKGGFELGDLKKGKNDDGRSKKGEEGFDGGKHHHHQQGFKHNEMKPNQKGGGGGGGGWNMDMMGQKGGFPAVAGMPAMNGGRYMPGPGNNPYSQQQQYLAHMMMMNQQRENGVGAYHPSAYGRPPPGMFYGPPAGMSYGAPPATTEQYTHMFSDENTGSCKIM